MRWFRQIREQVPPRRVPNRAAITSQCQTGDNSARLPLHMISMDMTPARHLGWHAPLGKGNGYVLRQVTQGDLPVGPMNGRRIASLAAIVVVLVGCATTETPVRTIGGSKQRRY